METNTILCLLLHLIFMLVPAAIILILIFYNCVHPSTTTTTKTTTFKTAPECRAIITAAQFPNTREKNQLTPHEARACSNQTLQRAFGF
jgi:hypothetical protein